MDEEIPQSPLDRDFRSQGLGRDFLQNVYRRATQVSVIAALIFMGMEQRQIALGLLSGTACGLFSTWTVEMTARLLFRGGSHSGLKLAVAAFVKMPFLLAGLVAVAWASFNGHMNIFAVVGGLLILHGTVFVMAVGRALANNDAGARSRG